MFVKSNSLYKKELVENIITKNNFNQDIKNMLNIALNIFDQNWKQVPEGFEGADKIAKLIYKRFI